MTDIKRIAIIGAGPTGVACARYMIVEDAFDCIDVFEQRTNVGGIWNLSQPIASKQIPIPQTNPSYETNIGQTLDSYHVDQHRHPEHASLEFESPLYDYLETNIPKTMMEFSDHRFSDELPLYPGHADVLKYLEDDAAPVRHLIHFQTRVVDVHLCDSTTTTAQSRPLRKHWLITTQDLTNTMLTTAIYDAVVIANGHYTVPHVPDIPGLATWHKKYPNSIIHSKAYRRPEDFKDKRVLVVGNSASGLDIAAQLASYVRTPLYLTSRSKSQLAPSEGGPQWREDIAEIEEFLVDENHCRSIRSKDGKIISDIDTIIFATGYFYSFPFLSTSARGSGSSPSKSSPSSSKTPSVTLDLSDVELDDNNGSPFSPTKPPFHLTTSGLRTHNVYKHFLHIEYPTLAIPVLNLKIVPFPLSENQAAVIARLWSGRLEIPSKAEMGQWEKDEEQRLLKANRLRPAPNPTSGKNVTNKDDEVEVDFQHEVGFHTLVYPEDARQMNTLYEWAASAKPRAGLENGGAGKLGTQWNERQVWLRGQFPNLKAAFARQGDGRKTITSLEDLGEEWSKGFEKWKTSTSEQSQKELFTAAATPGWR